MELSADTPNQHTYIIIHGVRILCQEIELWRIQQEMDHMEVSDNVLDRPFDSLSNGEKTKMLLCLLFQYSDRFMLIDEPTNHLDMVGDHG